jgi:hypothetical protein
VAAESLPHPLRVAIYARGLHASRIKPALEALQQSGKIRLLRRSGQTRTVISLSSIVRPASGLGTKGYNSRRSAELD